MKKDKPFDAVKLMRRIRDQMSKEIKGMNPKEQIEYIQEKSGVQRGQKNRATAQELKAPSTKDEGGAFFS